MLTSLLAGLGLGLSLIVAIGAQNLFVLRQGMRREHVVAVATICAVSDAALIVLGVSGVGLVLQGAPWLVDTVRWLGAAFLVGYGLLAARRAWRPSGAALGVESESEPDAGSAAESVAGLELRAAAGSTPGAHGAALQTRSRLTPVVLTVLALTWLNPHVYLDTVFLLGSIASTHGDDRWWFAAGAVVASTVWFFSLAFGARYLGRWLSTPLAWRVLDGIIAVVMIALGVSLVLPR